MGHPTLSEAVTWEVKVQELEQRLSEAAATRPSEMNFFVEETRSKYVFFKQPW